jgi:peptide/nickel transport system substrate-binding protein
LLRVAIDTDPQCLDPQQAGNNNSLNIGRQITDSLTDQRPNTGEIVPWLATKWEVSEDSREFTFQLRDGVTFSDGAPLDAAVVKANVEGIVKLGARASLGSGYLAGLKEVRTPDSRTVVIVFGAPNIQFLQATSTMSLGLLSPATLARSADERCQGQLIGTGPFTVTRFVHNQQARLTRRDDYAWPSSLAKHQGRAYLAGIEYRVIAESGVRTGSLLSRQIDVNASVPPQDERILQAQQIPILSRPNPGVVYNLFPNEADPLLREQAVRVAISKAINRPELQSIISQYQAPASAVLAKTTPLYTNLSSLLAFDPEGSRKLLDDAGWVVGSGGIRERNSQRLSIRLSYWQSTPFLELVQQQLRAVGVDLQLNRTTISQVTALRESGNYQLQFFNLTRADPDILRAVFGKSARNVNNRDEAPVDALLNASSAELDPERRRDLVASAETALIQEGRAIPLVELSTVIATAKTVHGLDYEASSRLQFFDAWIER